MAELTCHLSPLVWRPAWKNPDFGNDALITAGEGQGDSRLLGDDSLRSFVDVDKGGRGLFEASGGQADTRPLTPSGLVLEDMDDPPEAPPQPKARRSKTASAPKGSADLLDLDDDYQPHRTRATRRRDQDRYGAGARRNDDDRTARVIPQDSYGQRGGYRDPPTPASPGVRNPIVQGATRRGGGGGGGGEARRQNFKTTAGRLGNLIASIGDAVEDVRLDASLRRRQPRRHSATAPEPASPTGTHTAPEPRPAVDEPPLTPAKTKRRSRYRNSVGSDAGSGSPGGDSVHDNPEVPSGNSNRSRAASMPEAITPRSRAGSTSEATEESFPHAGQVDGRTRRRRRRGNSDAGGGEANSSAMI
jgi:hypothetical protein